MFSRYGGGGLTHLVVAVWPAKTARGIVSASYDALFIDNPLLN